MINWEKLCPPGKIHRKKYWEKVKIHTINEKMFFHLVILKQSVEKSSFHWAKSIGKKYWQKIDIEKSFSIGENLLQKNTGKR